MNIDKLHDCFIDDYDVATDIKLIFEEEKSEYFKIRKLHIVDPHYSGVSVKVKQKEYNMWHKKDFWIDYNFFIIHNKQFNNYSFIIMSDFEYKWEVIKRYANIKEKNIHGFRVDTKEKVKELILNYLREKDKYWFHEGKTDLDKEEVPF